MPVIRMCCMLAVVVIIFTVLINILAEPIVVFMRCICRFGTMTLTTGLASMYTAQRIKGTTLVFS